MFTLKPQLRLNDFKHSVGVILACTKNVMSPFSKRTDRSLDNKDSMAY